MPFRDQLFIDPLEPAFAVLTYGTTVTPDLSRGNIFRVNIANGTAWALAAPANRAVPAGEIIILNIRNTSGGAGGAITPNAIYRVATITAPANGQQLCIELFFDGTNWIESSRVTALAN